MKSWYLIAAMAFGVSATAGEVELRLLLPLDRTAYQTNESIPVAVVRSSAQALGASELAVALAGDDGSRMAFSWPLDAVPVIGNDARATEHLYLNARLLRPGRYSLEATANGAKAVAALEVFGHVRKSSFRLIAWGSEASPAEQELMGEDSLGFNLLLARGMGDHSIRGAVDWMQCCTQGGGFNLDLRNECDWSDPYVIRGGSARLSQAAFVHRRSPNAVGIHFYDEALLIKRKDPATNAETRHGVPEQVRAYRAAFGVDPIEYTKVDPNNPEDVARWRHWGLWRLGFLEANHRLDRFAVDWVRPDYLTATQSEFAWSWSNFAEGHYFNEDRSLPVISGHGGYSRTWAGYFNPSLWLEMLRARRYDKPNWYLPTWFAMGSNQFRMEQYLSFITSIQCAAGRWRLIRKLRAAFRAR